jgi:hypothetical protein
MVASNLHAVSVPVLGTVVNSDAIAVANSATTILAHLAQTLRSGTARQQADQSPARQQGDLELKGPLAHARGSGPLVYTRGSKPLLAQDCDR